MYRPFNAAIPFVYVSQSVFFKTKKSHHKETTQKVKFNHKSILISTVQEVVDKFVTIEFYALFVANNDTVGVAKFIFQHIHDSIFCYVMLLNVLSYRQDKRMDELNLLNTIQNTLSQSSKQGAS